MFKKLCVLFTIAAFTLTCVTDVISAPPSRGSSGFSSRSSSSASRSTSSSRSSSTRSSSGFSKQAAPKSSTSKTPSVSKQPVTTNSRSDSSGFNKSTPSKPQTTKSSVDKQVNKMVKVGNTNMTKEQAINKFKSENASTYTSKYKTEPTTRPQHIPKTYSDGGHTYNITYNAGYGGYGYYGPGNRWIMYDMMRDSLMLSAIMSSHPHYSQVVTTDGGVVVAQEPCGIFCVIPILVCIIFIVCLIYWVSRSNQCL